MLPRWINPDTIILNPQIPLEIFLPPSDFNNTNLIGTHDEDGFYGGGTLFRVNDWTVKFLIEVLALPRIDTHLDLGFDKAQTAMQFVLASETFRTSTMYQPRQWFSAVHLPSGEFEGKQGDLMVHFKGLEGDKWLSMAGYLNDVTAWHNSWEMQLHETTYEKEVDEYWARLRMGRTLLRIAMSRDDEEAIMTGSERLSHALSFQADNEDAMTQALDNMRMALRIPDAEVIV